MSDISIWLMLVNIQLTGIAVLIACKDNRRGGRR